MFASQCRDSEEVVRGAKRRILAVTVSRTVPAPPRLWPMGWG